MSQGQRSVTLESMEDLGFMSSDVCRKIQEIITLEVLISSKNEKSGRNMCVYFTIWSDSSFISSQPLSLKLTVLTN